MLEYRGFEFTSKNGTVLFLETFESNPLSILTASNCYDM